MVFRVVRFAGPLFNDDSFGVTAAAPHLWIHIILPIAASWKASLSVLKLAPADVARERRAVSFFQSLQEVIDFLGSASLGRGCIDGLWQGECRITRTRSQVTLSLG